MSGQTESAGRENNFNFIRMVLACLVLLSHSPELIDGNRSREILTLVFGTLSFGELAVDGFFILSGFLIAKSWASDPSIYRFLMSRVLRIYPGFIVASLFSVFIAGGIGAHSLERYIGGVSAASLVEGLIFLSSPSTPATFAGAPYPVVNGSLWTIRFEFICYLAILFIGVASRKFCLRNLLYLASAVILLSVFVFARFGLGVKLEAAGYFLQSGIRLGAAFSVGVIFFVMGGWLKFDYRLALLAGGALVLGMPSWRLSEVVLILFGGYLLFFFAFHKTRYLSGYRRLPDISYGIYLYAWPVQKVLIFLCPGISLWALVVMSIAFTAPLAVASWYLIEEPFVRMKAKKPALTTNRMQTAERVNPIDAS